MNILVTGGLGYIGSHTCIELLEAGHEVIVVDNLANAKIEVKAKIEKIAQKEITFYQYDLLDLNLVDEVFSKHQIDGVIHFAGLKAVGESVAKPLWYYDVNVNTTLNLLKTMEKYKVNNIVFSSSATVYGDPDTLPIKESAPLRTTNPYGTTKLFIEYILTDAQKANPDLSVVILRYFNPIGAHKSGLIGEDPQGIPNNIMPYIVRVASKQFPILNVFGNDYQTKDGTGVRDYIHVVDLAIGHVKSMKLFNTNTCNKINLGTGNGYSVLELVETYQSVNNIEVPYQFVDRRPGDIAACYADGSLAKELIDFETKFDLADMCRDSYNYIVNCQK